MASPSVLSNRWLQLAAGILCMVMISSLQHGWTLFVEPIDDKTISVRLVDGPFYADGARPEPVITRAALEEALKPWFECIQWKPMLDEPNGLVSDIYSTFIFRRKY